MNRNLKKYSLLPAAVLLFWACGNETITAPEVITKADTRYEIADSVEIIYSDSAVVRVRITAPLLFNYTDEKEPKRVFPKGIIIDFFGQNKKIQSRLTAKRGTQYERTGTFVMEDSVVVKRIDGSGFTDEVLETESLTWDEAQKRVFTERFVTMRTTTEIVTGYGLESDYTFKNWKVKKVSGRLESKRLKEQFQE
jgi:LPS export ABC transporter protein LptC